MVGPSFLNSFQCYSAQFHTKQTDVPIFSPRVHLELSSMNTQGSYTQCFVITYKKNDSEKENRYHVNHFAVHLKLEQHSKSTIFQFVKNGFEQALRSWDSCPGCPIASSGGMVRGSTEERASDPKGGHQQLVFLHVGPYKTTSPDSTSCHQMLSFQPFIGAVMNEEHSIDCSSYCCCLSLAQPREFA